MKEPEGFDIRYTYLIDESYLVDWLSEKENNYWFPMSDPSEIASSSKNWVGFSKFNSSLTATIDKVPVGMATIFLMPYKKVAHHASFYLIVDKKKKNLGIESALLKNILNHAKNYFKLEWLHIEIFDDDPIVSLLKENNFIPIATQPYFVKVAEGKYLSRTLYQHIF